MDSAKLAIERLIALGRVILAASLLLTALLLAASLPAAVLLQFTFAIYLAYALVILVFLHRRPEERWLSRALVGDLVVLAVALLVAVHFPLATLYFVLFLGAVGGARRSWRMALLLSVVLSGVFLLATERFSLFLGGSAAWASSLTQARLAVLAALIAGGGLIGYVAQRERRYLVQRYEFESVAILLRLDTRWEEMWRRWLEEMCRRFRARRCLLAQRDPETDRVVLWQLSAENPPDSYREEERPPRDAATFLVNDTDTSFLANGLCAPAQVKLVARQGLSEHPAPPPTLPVRLLEEFRPRSVLSVGFPLAGVWSGRLWLLDAHNNGFTLSQFDALQQLLNSLSPTLANLLTVRRLLAQAVAAERERIVRDLHDGVAQTVASVEMQLGVFQRLVASEPEKLAVELEELRQVVQAQKEELRRYLRALKPVRVPAAELADWILAHCLQFQQETGIEVDTLVDPVGASVPEGVCREVFLILREALHNVHKHAQAKHVLVKLRQDEGYLRLLVDDDGRGFPFTGTYSQHALEEQGLGPVSICERVRALGGTLTIDSTPGSGATLRVDIPLS